MTASLACLSAWVAAAYFGGRVLVGAGGARSIDGTLRLIHLFVRRLRTRDRDEDNHEPRAPGEPRGETHKDLSIAEGLVRSRVSMKTVAPHDRPREKLERLGPAGLGDNELLALVAGKRIARPQRTGSGQRSDRPGRRNAWAHARDGRRPSSCRWRRSRTGGAGARGNRAGAPNARSRRCRAPQPQVARAIGRLPAAAIWSGCRRAVRDRDAGQQEPSAFGSGSLRPGTVDSAVVHPREVFREAAAAAAAAIVLFHNHPSGDPTPSEDDLILTNRMVSAGMVMGIDVVDHIILGERRYCSLLEAGVLPKRV